MPAEMKSKIVRVQMEIPMEIPSLYATNFSVQRTDQDVVLAFFEARLPVVLGANPEAQRKKLEALEEIPSKCLARFVMTPPRALELIQLLLQNVTQHESAMARGADAGPTKGQK